MPKRKILIFSEMRPARQGWAGGYSAVTHGLALALHEAGHEVKVLAMSYDKTPHDEPFAIIPFLDFNYTEVQLNDIVDGWWPDAVVAAMDLPMQMEVFKALKGKRKYIAVYPIEGEPVVTRWAEQASLFDSNLILSHFGVKAMKTAGLRRAKYFPCGITRGTGRAEPAQVQEFRKLIQLEDKYVVVKVADNHARKNWAHTIEFWSRWSPPDTVLYMVTRPDNPWGWNLDDLLEENGGQPVKGTKTWRWKDGKEVRMVSDLGRSDLSWIYNFARERGCLLQDSGNEGLCLPILEAMWVGLPVVGMNHTAIGELLAEDRGFLFEPGYMFRDIFGNVKRYHPAYETWAAAMTLAYTDQTERTRRATLAQQFADARPWAAAADAVLAEI